MNIKDTLCLLELVEENSYLDLYVDLITNNKSTKRIKYVTQKHHIIPRSYYKKYSIELDNSVDNIVNLYYKDHILSHYYLYKCAKESWFKQANAIAVFLSLQKDDVENFGIQELSDLQEIYSISCKFIGESKKNKMYVYKENIIKMIDKKDLETYILQGFKLGRPKGTKMWVNKDGLCKLIEKHDIDLYLNLGYNIGHNHSTSQKLKMLNYRTINNGSIQTSVPESDLDEWLNNGFKLGVLPTSKSKKGHPNPYKGTKGIVNSTVKDTVWVNNGIISKRVAKDYLDNFLSTNAEFKVGMIEDSCWVNNGIKNKRIKRNQLDGYINNGFILGMKGRRNE